MDNSASTLRMSYPKTLLIYVHLHHNHKEDRLKHKLTFNKHHKQIITTSVQKNEK